MDRISITHRPRGYPVIRQQWGKLLFLHWPIPADVLRPRIPESLAIDTWDGTAWIGLTPFTMWGVRPSFMPPLPGLSAFHELNVRTYVHHNEVPGIYFLSLDASSALAVRAARRFYHLPYHTADMSLTESGNSIRYRSNRTDAHAPPAGFSASWQPGKSLPGTMPGSLDFFLTERYCFYTEYRSRLFRCRIHHRPWPLREARLISLDSTLLQSHGLSPPRLQPRLNYAEALSVDIWPLIPVEAFSRTRNALKKMMPEVDPLPGRNPV